MEKIKKSFFNLGILILSFLLIACGSEESVNDSVSSKQKTKLEQKIAEHGYVEAQADGSSEQKAANGDADDQSETDEKDSWYGKVTNWFGGLFNGSDELQKTAVNEDAQVSDAVSSLIKAAEQGHAQAQYQLGWMYKDGEGGVPKDLEKSIHWLEKAAEQEHVSAQFRLGWMYRYGDGISKDLEKSIYWLEKSAENGDAEAQFDLGLMYFYERGVLEDRKKAFYWLEKAAEQGHRSAQYKIGWMYYNERGISKDSRKGVYWLEKAAEQGHKAADQKLKEIYYW